MAKPSILVTYKLPSAATAPLEAIGNVEVYRDGVLTHAELVKRVKGRVPVELSGNVRLDTIAAYAATGVDYISCGALTHSAPAADLSLEVELERA